MTSSRERGADRELRLAKPLAAFFAEPDPPFFDVERLPDSMLEKLAVEDVLAATFFTALLSFDRLIDDFAAERLMVRSERLMKASGLTIEISAGYSASATEIVRPGSSLLVEWLSEPVDGNH